MTTSRTPLRRVRAYTVHANLIARAGRIESYISALPKHERAVLPAFFADNSEHAGVLAALSTLGPTMTTIGRATLNDWIQSHNDLDSLNVTAVIRHLTRDHGWRTCDVEAALNDLDDDGKICLVGGRGPGEVGIQLIVRIADRGVEDC
jgi:hypothetical protein